MFWVLTGSLSLAAWVMIVAGQSRLRRLLEPAADRSAGVVDA